MHRPRLICLVLTLIAIMSLFPVSASAQAGSGAYVVQVGDTVATIAAAHGVSSNALVRANGITNSNLIRVGQRLVIPGKTVAPAAPAAPAKVPVAAAAPAAVSATAPAGGYTVKAGDTLSGIALRFGTTTGALMRANNLASADRVVMGRRLIIPGGSTSSGAIGGTAAKGAGLEATRLMVSISQQYCRLIVNNAAVGAWPCSTGRAGSYTLPGTFHVQSKLPVAYGGTWDFFMPYWLGIYTVGKLENGIHGLPYSRVGIRTWGNKIGTPISFGCVVLQDAAAKKVYDNAFMGMQVIIQR